MTKFTESKINGGWIIDAVRHGDDRGWFQELFKSSVVRDATGFSFAPVQINVSHSLQGVIRGIHYSIASEGQGKYVTVVDGEIDDYIIDVRIDSPTFGQWEKIRLSATSGNSVLLSSDLAHAFQVISPHATVCYAVTAEFNPEAEKAINPNCSELKIEWESRFPSLVSAKDNLAPSLSTQRSLKQLPQITK